MVPIMDSGKFGGDGCIGANEKETPDANPDFGTDTEVNAVGVLIAHVYYLLISRTYAIISYLSDRLGNEYGLEVSDGSGSIYFGMWVEEVSNEFTDSGGIPE